MRYDEAEKPIEPGLYKQGPLDNAYLWKVRSE